MGLSASVMTRSPRMARSRTSSVNRRCASGKVTVCMLSKCHQSGGIANCRFRHLSPDGRPGDPLIAGEEETDFRLLGKRDRVAPLLDVLNLLPIVNLVHKVGSMDDQPHGGFAWHTCPAQPVHVGHPKAVEAEMRLLDLDEELLPSPRRLKREIKRVRPVNRLEPGNSGHFSPPLPPDP